MRVKENKSTHFWELENVTVVEDEACPLLNFRELENSILNVGIFYFFIIDIHDRSISNVSSSITDFYGFNPREVTFDNILKTIHPDDMSFVAKAEEVNLKYMDEIIGKENIKNYKSNYSFRSKIKNNEYCLLNHQGIVLTVDAHGCIRKLLNIHTDISHITTANSRNMSLIGLKGNPSYLDIVVGESSGEVNKLSKRELEVIKLVAEGNTNAEIASKLVISTHTVKTHRKNINKKASCKNIAELLRKIFFKDFLR